MTMENKKTLLDWALEYHHTGINVVKVFYKGKFPPKGGEWGIFAESDTAFIAFGRRPKDLN